MRAQTKARERVRDFGEVFTAEREVNAMLDLVKQEACNIDSTFLEPACGDGNFLVEILNRKLDSVFRLAKMNDADAEYWATRAISTIYGVDIQQDNVAEARERLFSNFFARFVNKYRHQPSNICMDSIRFILSQNIQCGNTLTGLYSDGTPLVITQWVFDASNGLTIQLYDYSDMVRTGSTCAPFKVLPRVPYLMLPAIFSGK